MKRLAYCGAGLAILCAVFSMSYYLSYKKALENFNNSAVAQNLSLLSRLTEEEKNRIYGVDGDEGSLNQYEMSARGGQADINGANKLSDQAAEVRQGNANWPEVQGSGQQGSSGELEAQGSGQQESDGGTESGNAWGVDAQTAGSTEAARVKPTTVYILETYDLCNKTMLREELKPPADFVGLDREGVVGFLSEYMKDMPLKEYADGLISYELVTFSPKEFVVRKTYNQELVPNKFYLAIRGGNVVIYYSDMETVYEYTDIDAMQLSESERGKLIKGYYVKDLDELYSVLEGYTS